MGTPALSVVVATLNEASNLNALLRGLAAQRGLRLEWVLADGGSDDGTVEGARALSRELSIPLTVVAGPAGRGRQMNAGARASSAADILFLHADSELHGPEALLRSQQAVEGERVRRGTDRVAGHFGVRFRRAVHRDSFGYYYFEAKTCLNRTGCVSGDQGFWLSRRFLEELGGFDEALPMLEDSRLADRIFAVGSWITLPGRLTTSARRFEAEGLRDRHMLNALIRAFGALGHTDFFAETAGLYRRQDQAERLDLLPFFRLAHRHMIESGFARSWYRAGSYARSQAWQLAFALDSVRNYRGGIPAGDGPTPLLTRFDHWFDRLTDNRAGRLLAGLLAASWFYGTLAWLRTR